MMEAGGHLKNIATEFPTVLQKMRSILFVCVIPANHHYIINSANKQLTQGPKMPTTIKLRNR